MKCQVCKFDEEEKQEREVYEKDLKFLVIEGHFTVLKDRDGWHERRVEITVYACPKCGTLRINEN